MFCSNCGEKLDDGAKFCTKCGTAVGAIPTGVPTQPVTHQSQINAMPQEANQQPQQPLQPSAVKHAKTYRITGWICIVFGCLGTAVGVANSAGTVLIYTIPMTALGFFALDKAKKLEKTK